MRIEKRPQKMLKMPEMRKIVIVPEIKKPTPSSENQSLVRRSLKKKVKMVRQASKDILKVVKSIRKHKGRPPVLETKPKGIDVEYPNKPWQQMITQRKYKPRGAIKEKLTKITICGFPTVLEI
nr:PREDICTED: uncharacterized protein LOC109038964 [Bemisia tabaci]